jgi:hypothetical protein
MTRYGVFVHDPEGDIGYGVIVGPFYTAEKAETKAEAIRRRDGMYGGLECIVVPVLDGAASARRITDEVRS